MASARDDIMVSRKGRGDVGLRGHGFLADDGVFTTIDAPGAGLYTVAFGIDTRGRTAGSYVDAQGTAHGFLRDEKGAVITIDSPGAKGTFASRVNDQGQVGGVYSDEPNTPALKAPHGFILDNGVFTKIDIPGAVQTRPFGINNAGQIVGEYVDTAGTSRGFLLDQGAFTAIEAPDGTATWATDIDDSGRIVGISFGAANTIGGSVRGFLRDAQGAFTTIEAPPEAVGPPDPARPESPQTLSSGLNNRGQITGAFTDSEGRPRGFLLDNGLFTTVDVPGATSTLIAGINDRG
jgi:uncharacterized membrane protein